MKHFLLFFSLIILSEMAFSQVSRPKTLADLSTIYLSPGISFHLNSPQPINYVDISPGYLKADLPLANLLRIRMDSSAMAKDISREIGSLTVASKSFFAQYKLIFSAKDGPVIPFTQMEIAEKDMIPLWRDPGELSYTEMNSYAMEIMKNESKAIASKKRGGVEISLKGIYCKGDYIFLDVLAKNQTQMSYDMESLEIAIEDKKINKATNHQSIPVPIVYSLYPISRFESTFRNIYIIKKATFSNDKILKVSMSERQLSSRIASLDISYRSVLRAQKIN